VGNEVTPGDDLLELRVPAALGVGPLSVWIDDEPVGEMQPGDEGAFDMSELSVGEHELIVWDEGTGDFLLEHTFTRTHPLYVIVSTDWDTSDNPDANMRRQDMLHDHHPHLRMTHFFGPYTFTDPALAPGRVEAMTDWVLNARDTFGDEIGLHIHPYCHFVESAGLTCKLEPVYAESWRDPGYTTYCSAYDEDEFTQLLEHAKELFVAHGLNTPRTFRAGGWTLELHTMKALENAGFLADTSANNWQRLEEWRDHTDASLYSWNSEHWATIDETSQPYYPSVDDILTTGPEIVRVLEVPDNGILADYVTSQEMIEMLRANWDGRALSDPRQYSIGYHPPSLDATYFARIDGALDEIDRHLAENGDGPIVYATLSEMVGVWPQPNAPAGP
jgi:hypothetical protein